jgi:hypothetical protein
MFDDPYERRLKPQLGIGEHFVMLLFMLMVVCVGFLMVKSYIIDPMTNPAPQPAAGSNQK